MLQKNLKNLPRAIDRFTASKVLRVSIRTIDRYIKAGRLQSEEVNGRVWLSRDQVFSVREKRENPAPDIFDEKKPEEILVTHERDREHDRIDRHIHEKRLESAQYRIDQLEEQLAELSSRLNYKTTPAAAPRDFQDIVRPSHDIRSPGASNYGNAAYENTAYENVAAPMPREENRSTENQLREALARERFNRRVITALLYLTLIAQPILWYLFINR